ncbi:hypothetical protein BGZ61DRAFT_526235 [Ilyonectria robusta]|uniref:uncharacterized protein n=1 Tax=Ilyonectria robusta TaxID=1079257 RepID=UPI001E8EE5BA|nr:uncharacterized protein BGZ61DRAFT_526235 [Ilyonectria robusta]KAH8738245.1 hypothetical protein BGZ61DRAFT_526235 [Ilyonectria robusta]
MAPVYVMEPPEGEVRTAVQPPSSAGGVLPAGVATTVLACIAVCLRLFTRKYVVKGVLGLDDYMCLCALGFSIIFLGLTSHLSSLGAGHHMWDILLSDFSPHFWQTSISATLIFAVSIAFSKLSVLFFFLRISPDRVIRRAVHTLISLICVYTLVYIFLMIFRCRPVSSGWDLTVEGQCIDSLVPMLTLSIANIVIDLFVLLLPIRIVIPLQIPLRQKISLALLFATGGFVCVASIKRTVIMSPLLRSDDYSWDVSQQIIWTYIEVNAGVICASVPALKPFCMRYIPIIISARLRGASQDKSSSKKQSNGADKKRRSRNIYSYEMPSRDEVSETTLQDDEARLWSLRGAKNNGKPREIIQEMESFDTLADNVTLPPKPEPAVVGFGTKRTENVNGIQITKETYISYGPA